MGASKAGQVSPLQLVTDDYGSFSLAQLPSGSYRVEVRLPGAAAPSIAKFQLRGGIRQLVLTVQGASFAVREIQAATTIDSAGEQQYSIHGQAGTQAVFALDGGDTTDPEQGGAPSPISTSMLSSASIPSPA